MRFWLFVLYEHLVQSWIGLSFFSMNAIFKILIKTRQKKKTHHSTTFTIHFQCIEYIQNHLECSATCKHLNIKWYNATLSLRKVENIANPTVKLLALAKRHGDPSTNNLIRSKSRYIQIQKESFNHPYDIHV